MSHLALDPPTGPLPVVRPTPSPRPRPAQVAVPVEDDLDLDHCLLNLRRAARQRGLGPTVSRGIAAGRIKIAVHMPDLFGYSLLLTGRHVDYPYRGDPADPYRGDHDGPLHSDGSAQISGRFEGQWCEINAYPEPCLPGYLCRRCAQLDEAERAAREAELDARLVTGNHPAVTR